MISVCGQAPYLGGGFGHFYAYAPHKDEYAINRFAMEVCSSGGWPAACIAKAMAARKNELRIVQAKRQLDVVDKQLGKTGAYSKPTTPRSPMRMIKFCSVLSSLAESWQITGVFLVCGAEYTIADMAIWPWYGVLCQGKLYGAEEFLAVHEYDPASA